VDPICALLGALVCFCGAFCALLLRSEVLLRRLCALLLRSAAFLRRLLCAFWAFPPDPLNNEVVTQCREDFITPPSIITCF